VLPFLKRKDEAAPGLTIKTRTPDQNEEKDSDSIESCAKELISAIHSHDAKATASALKAIFEIADSEPHEEGPHTNENKEK
jgi:hypothetical protein